MISLLLKKDKTTISVEDGVSTQRNVCMVSGKEEYCSCQLSIRTVYNARTNFKVAQCASCMMLVNPDSKSINKNIDRINTDGFADMDAVHVANKVNEIIDLLRANGAMEGRRPQS